MNTNRVSATLLTADQEAVMTALGVIRERLPFLIDLTTAERVILPKLGDKTQPFVKKAVDIARQHPELLRLASWRRCARTRSSWRVSRRSVWPSISCKNRSMIRSFRSAPRLRRQHERCMP